MTFQEWRKKNIGDFIVTLAVLTFVINVGSLSPCFSIICFSSGHYLMGCVWIYGFFRSYHIASMVLEKFYNDVRK